MIRKLAIDVQGHRKRWTEFETAITSKVLDGFTHLASYNVQEILKF